MAAWDAVAAVVADDDVVGPAVPEAVAARAIAAIAAHLGGSAAESRRQATQCAPAFPRPPTPPLTPHVDCWSARASWCTHRAAGWHWRCRRWVTGRATRVASPRALTATHSRPPRQGGRFADAVRKGRNTLLHSVRRTRFREARWRTLEGKRWRGAPLGAKFHLRDLVGMDLVEVESTTSGKLVRVPREGT